MNIKLSGFFRFDDYRRALAMQYAGMLRLVRSILFIYGGIVLGLLVTAERASAVIGDLLPTLLIVAILAYMLLLPRQQAIRLMRSPLAQGPIVGYIDDTTIHWSGPTHTTDLPWNIFQSYKYDQSVVSLFQSKQDFSIISRSIFGSDEDWELFVAHTQEILPENVSNLGRIMRYGQWMALVLAILLFAAAVFPAGSS